MGVALHSGCCTQILLEGDKLMTDPGSERRVCVCFQECWCLNICFVEQIVLNLKRFVRKKRQSTCSSFFFLWISFFFLKIVPSQIDLKKNVLFAFMSTIT